MKIYDAKTKKATVVFKEYQLNGATACPECHRQLKEFDFKRLEENGRMSCLKCGAKLIK
jgi:uncharacterized CHY-type Zn-finger protein